MMAAQPGTFASRNNRRPGVIYFLQMLLKAVSAVLILATAAFAADHPVIPLWANGAPGSEGKSAIPEKSEPTGNNEFRVSSIHNPSLTVFLPSKEKATGAAVIIAPGGGHRFLSWVSEGTNVGEYLASIGVAGFVLNTGWLTMKVLLTRSKRRRWPIVSALSAW